MSAFHIVLDASWLLFTNFWLTIPLSIGAFIVLERSSRDSHS